MTSKRLPRHIGFIMDGNGRWADAHGLPRIEGHRKGAEALDVVTEHSLRRGIKAVTVYAFSYENWSRPSEEVRLLMQLLEEALERRREDLMAQDIRFKAIGELEMLSEGLQAKLADIAAQTGDNNAMTLCVAISYSARHEILKAACRMDRGEEGLSGTGCPCPEDLARHLYTSDMPELDLVVRTSGEKRLSNFLLWQAAYAELYFTDTLWPDFDSAEYDKVLEEFVERERRFGA